MFQKKQNHSEDNSYRITKDMQTGRFYKIHNQNGRQVSVNKDGSQITRFKPGISGHHPDNRQQSQLATMSTRYQQWLDKDIGNHHSEKNNHSPFTTNRYKIERRSEQKDSQHSSKSFHSSVNFRIKQRGQNSVDSINLRRLTNYSSNNEKQKNQKFKQILRSFNTIVQNRDQQNFSFKKQQIPGSKKLNKLAQQNLISGRHFFYKPLYNSLNSIPKQEKVEAKRTLQYLPESLSARRQYLKDRQLYFSIHPDQRIIQKAPNFDRRINLKKLQSQFLRKSEMKTSKIYETIQA